MPALSKILIQDSAKHLFTKTCQHLKQNNVVHDKVNLELPVLHITNFVFTNLNVQIPKTKIYYYTGNLNQHL
jgi:hypothetical protein